MLSNILKKNNVSVFGVTNQIDFSYLKLIHELKEKKRYFSSIDERDFEKRANLNTVFNGVKSVISMAFPYNLGEIIPFHEYKISKYALCADYHSVVKNIMNNIVNDLKDNFPENNFEVYVDSNPLFEKEIAKLCGVGDIGKNSLLYTENYGSSVFLGEILTDLVIEPIKHSDFTLLCSSCNLCIDHCPNGALKDHTLDASQCISYLTCSKEDIEFDSISNNLWGCDICQDICPMNKNKTLSDISDFNLQDDIFMSLEDIINMSNKKLKEFYKNSPILWTGPFPLKRNAIILMAKSKKVKYIPILDSYIKVTQNERLVEYAKKAILILKKSL